MPPRPVTFAERVLRHLVSHGIVALIVAAFSLILLRGLDPRIMLLCGLPPVFAALYTRPPFSPATRCVAWAFLGAIGLGSLVVHVPQLFPNLKAFDPQLAPWQNRLLTWYLGMYVIWLTGIGPVHLFLGNLRAHRHGRPALLSRFTCYLGLFTTALFWVGLPGLLALFGFWPVV